MDKETAILTLQQAKETLETTGWTNGQESGRHCLATAMPFAVNGQFIDLDDVTTILGFETIPSIWNWNDEPSRTKEEVFAKIDERIAYWESQS